MRRLAAVLVAFAILVGSVVPAQAQARNVRLYIVHGYGASPTAHWFPWLKREMERRGATVSVVELPSPEAPEPDAWQRALEAQVPAPDADTYFVAHSLGGIALLRFLAAHAETPVGGYLLVSGFNDSLAILPQLDGFRDPAIDYARLVDLARSRTVVAARDDTIVPYVLSLELADALKARFVTVERGGHFLASDGFTEFPLLRDELERMLAQAP